jgi:hypothetical protein
MPGHLTMLLHYIHYALGYGDDAAVIGHDFVNHDNAILG